jgi:CheY-like chemotaxis protein
MQNTILLVEDDFDIRESIQELLESEGYDVHVAKHGREALEKLPTLPDLNLVIVDLLMPVMDGVEFILKLRSGAHQPNVPVIVMSASSTLLPPEGTRVVRKPISTVEFLRSVEAACPRPVRHP